MLPEPTEGWDKDNWQAFLALEPEDDPPLPRKATRARPGTVQKVEALRWRVAEGEHLWHPEDATWESLTGVGVHDEAIRRACYRSKRNLSQVASAHIRKILRKLMGE